MPAGRVVQRHVLYLCEINDSQQASWLRCIEAFDPQARQQVRLALFPDDRPVPAHAADCGVRVRLRDFAIRRSCQWGACWLFLQLWAELHLPRLPARREGTSWYHVLDRLCAYRLIAPGSEWQLHREWFERSAMADLLGEDYALAAKDTLYRALDRLCEHKDELFHFLQERWQDLFGLTFDVLPYDLTSTYFESDPPFPAGDPRRHGYSRDHRPDYVQVVIAWVVTPEGFPLAYEVLAGNTADATTLRAFLKKIETRYGKARRIWVMDRGIPTEEVLATMRQSDPLVNYVVGTPKGRLTQLEAALTQNNPGTKRASSSARCPAPARKSARASWANCGPGAPSIPTRRALLPGRRESGELPKREAGQSPHPLGVRRGAAAHGAFVSRL